LATNAISPDPLTRYWAAWMIQPLQQEGLVIGSRMFVFALAILVAACAPQGDAPKTAVGAQDIFSDPRGVVQAISRCQ
jgi:hypothetical protein